MTVETPVPVGTLDLPGSLEMPDHPTGLVVFAHGSGSGRLSPRNLAVAEALRSRGFATLLFDLLTPDEAADRRNVFDIGLLADRLAEAAVWANGHGELRHLPVGVFGASTGAAAALRAAADRPLLVESVVSRGGRPDLAGDALPWVFAPTLLIVGSRDPEVLQLNRAAMARMRGRVELEIVPGAGHLFEEPGTLERVADLAAGWFERTFDRPS
jgi:putative phosphoribosyl transferase